MRSTLAAYCIVFDLIGPFTKLESNIKRPIKTNTEYIQVSLKYR